MAIKATVTAFLFLCFFIVNTSLYRRHIYVNENMTWTDAQLYCRKYHDDLSTASNIEVKLLSANPKITSEYFWIGLQRDSQSPLLWKWSGGENASNVMWDAGQPDALHEQCAAVLKSNGKMHDATCFLSIPFYCMEVFELILVQKENTWIEALEYCRQMHVDLASLTSDLMMREAKNKSTPAHADDVWIGLRFIAGHWFWVNGNNVEYKGWSLEGEPQCPTVDQRCGVFDKKKIVWKPDNCERRLNFLCLKKNRVTAEGSSN
uniref:Zgc:194252 n=1 Tax=Sinocyclocheilus rhinocerous TaxID=307959 RepID=A0A673HT57_9TELE